MEPRRACRGQGLREAAGPPRTLPAPDPPGPRSPPGRQRVPGTARSAAPAAGVQGQRSSRRGHSAGTPQFGERKWGGKKNKALAREKIKVGIM